MRIGTEASDRGGNLEELIVSNHTAYEGRSSTTLRDLLTIAFRHRRIMMFSFFGVLCGAVLTAVLQSNQYDAAMKILVKRDRVDPIVTAEATASPQAASEVSEEELNSEVELLKGRDLLEKTVLACGLQNPKHQAGLGLFASALPDSDAADAKPYAGPDTGHLAAVALVQVLPDTTPLKFVPIGESTEVDVEVMIDQTGRVIEAHAKNGNNRALIASAITAARQWIFEPAKSNGNDVASLHTIKFQFHPQSQDLGIGFGLQKAAATRTIASEAQDLRSDFLRDASRRSALIPSDPTDFTRSLTLAPVTNIHTEALTAAERVRVAKAVRTLEKELRVEVVKKTNLIAANYRSRDPVLAARVLNTLANLYLEKHVTVHRAPGTFDFFQHETERYREELSKAEARFSDFNHEAGVVSAALEKDGTLQKLSEFQVTLSQTTAAIAETKERIRKLREEAASTPARMVTQVRNADDAVLLSQLRATLLTLEQKRTELLGKFEPTYRPVQELQSQIAQTRLAIASAEKSQLHEETTDRDPTYEWNRGELAKTEADLAGLQARAQAIGLAVQSYQEKARGFQDKEMVQNDLSRTIKSTEENYLLYLRKQEEARMSDALDRGRILNVTIAEAPTIPSIPSNHRSRTVLIGVFLAGLVSVGLTFAAERLDSTFRTPEEVAVFLDVPVLAAIPQDENGVINHILKDPLGTARGRRPAG